MSTQEAFDEGCKVGFAAAIAAMQGIHEEFRELQQDTVAAGRVLSRAHWLPDTDWGEDLDDLLERFGMREYLFHVARDDLAIQILWTSPTTVVLFCDRDQGG